MAYACKPNYSGDRDQEDCSLKPAQANSSRDPILKIPSTKRAVGVALGVGSEFMPWYRKKNQVSLLLLKISYTRTHKHIHVYGFCFMELYWKPID
jgi:hypothetical protein